MRGGSNIFEGQEDNILDRRAAGGEHNILEQGERTIYKRGEQHKLIRACSARRASYGGLWGGRGDGAQFGSKIELFLLRFCPGVDSSYLYPIK